MERNEKINLLYDIIREASTYILKEDIPTIIQQGFEPYRDIVTLCGKQTNLLSSILLLLENGHSEESYVLLRSQINNYMLVKYLCTDDNNQTRYKEYILQPLITQYKFLKDIRRAISNGWLSKNEFSELNSKIRTCERQLRDYGCDPRDKKQTIPITVAKLANLDANLFKIYISLYREASKEEHSDPTSLKNYRDQIVDDVSADIAYKLNLSKSNIELESNILNVSVSTYFLTLRTFLDYINTEHADLLMHYNTKMITEIMLNAAILLEDLPIKQAISKLAEKLKR